MTASVPHILERLRRPRESPAEPLQLFAKFEPLLEQVARPLFFPGGSRRLDLPIELRNPLLDHPALEVALAEAPSELVIVPPAWRGQSGE